MDTTASRYAARLVETGWLAAVIAVPVFFNVWSNRVFEPDKLTLLRSIAVVMAVGMALWAVERGRATLQSPRGWLATPLVGPVLALSAVFLVSSLLSVAPRLSLFGSYQRLQGLYTWLAYVTVFAGIVLLLRRRAQLERLLLAVIVPSLPVALYGVIQNRGLDPMPWLGDVTFRVASTMGNSIFVAAYVVVVIPLTIVKVWQSLRAIDADAGGEGVERPAGAVASASVLRAAAYMVLLFVQLVCLVLAQSRGPWLGLGGALFLMALIAAALHPRLAARRALAGAVFVGLGVLPAAGLLAFNLAPEGSALSGLRDTQYVGRLGRVLETEGGTGKVRVLIWHGAMDLATSDPGRFLVGYGPESMHVAYNPHYPPELAHYESRNASPDRSHNETLDALVTSGLLGLLVYLALFTALFTHALQWLGLVQGRRQRNAFLAFWLGGGALAVAAFTLWSGGWTFFGVALPAGMMAGLVTYVFARALSPAPIVERPGRLLVLGLTAAIAAHFVEIHFGIAIAATRLLFFTLMGLLVVVGGLQHARPGLLADGLAAAWTAVPEGQTPSRPKRGRRARRTAHAAESDQVGELAASGAFVMLVLLVTMAFDFLVRGLTSDSPLRAQELMVLAWLFSLTWAVGSLILVSEALLRPGGAGAGTGGRIGRYALVTLAGAGLYATVHQVLLGGGAGQAAGAATSSALLALYYLTILGLMLGWAWLLAGRGPRPQAASRLGNAPFGLMAGAASVAAVVLAVVTNFNEVRADIYYKEGWAGYHAMANSYLAQGDRTTADAYFDGALSSYDRALALDGGEDYYLLFKGKALLERADGRAQALDDALAGYDVRQGFSEYDHADLQPHVEARDRAFLEATEVLSQALRLSPLNTDHYANLGRAYQVWGERTYAGPERLERLQRSVSWFEQAIQRSPNNAGLRTEMATSAFLAGDDEAALDRIGEATALDDRYGRPYRLRATIHRDAGDWEAAEADYRRYVETRDGRRDAVGWSGLAFVLGQQGKRADAIEANLQVLELAGSDLPTLRNLVLLFRDTGDTASACAYAEQGLLVDPDDPGLVQLTEQLNCPLARPAGQEPTEGGSAP